MVGLGNVGTRVIRQLHNLGVEVVAIELVGPVAVGDRLLVHAGGALERLSDQTGESS